MPQCAVYGTESAETVPCALPPEIWEFPVKDGLVVARPDVQGLFCLNDSARVIWEAYRATGCSASASEVLAEVFELSLEIAQRDVARTLAAWADSHLLGPRCAAPALTPSTAYARVPVQAVHCRIGNARFRLEMDSIEAVNEILPRIESIRVEPSEPGIVMRVSEADCGFAVLRDGTCFAVEESVAGARTVLFQEMVRLAEPGREWLALCHAGACGMNGRCIIFPAASFSGKTTLAAKLMKSGYVAYSDDFVGLEGSRLCIPAMPFALAIRSGSWEVLDCLLPELRDREIHLRFGEPVKFWPSNLAEDEDSAQPVAIVFSRWEKDAAVCLRSLTTMDALERLNECGFWVKHDRQSVGKFLGWLEGLPKYELRYGDLAQAVSYVDDVLSEAGMRLRDTGLSESP
ncbi:MAG TPA: PqqD family protein [Bryobacteraceae bacterium]|nr:PqqD family protein [Bryobacteraceae bacterium]